jgi:hypothetical protein
MSAENVAGQIFDYVSRMCNVVHCKRAEYDVYIGRPSVWGNPFSHREGTLAQFKVDTREQAVAKYEEYLLSSPYLMGRLKELKGKTLGCWCHPLPCHGDILKKYVDKLESDDGE